MASPIKTWNEVAEEFANVVAAHVKGLEEEIDGLIADCEPFIREESKRDIRNALEDLCGTIGSVEEEINSEMDALEERRLSRACGFIIRLSDGDR